MTFIYDRPDWPNFRWDMAALAAPLAETRFLQGKLIGRMQELGLELQDEADLRMFTEDALKTSEIEGERLDAAEVRSSFARRLGLDDAGLVKADRRTEGLAEMLLDATRNSREPLTEARLFKWHEALMPPGSGWPHPILRGAWRNDALGPMQVVSGPLGRETVHFRAPPAERVPAEMTRFLDWFERADDRTDALIKAAVAHIWFVTIHPFDDGNGRMARAVADLAIARAEGAARRLYSVSAMLRAERSDYYEGLEAAQKGDLDLTDRLVWFLAMIKGAIAQAETTVSDVVLKGRFWRGLAERPVNQRQRQMLNRLLDGAFEGKLTTSKWAKLTKSSPDTALRDIDQLVEWRAFEKGPAGGRSTHYVLAAKPPT